MSHNDDSSIFSYILRYIYQCLWVYDSHPHGHYHADGKNKTLASFTHLAKHFSTHSLRNVLCEMCGRLLPFPPRKKTPPDFKKRPFTGVEPVSVWLGKEIIWTWVVKKQEKWNVRERTDENTVTKRFKSVNMSRKTKSVNLQFELDFVGLRWHAP